MTAQDVQAAAVESPFIRGEEALVAYLGIHPRTVRKWRRARRLPFTKLGGMILFRKSDIERMLERATVPAIGMKLRRAQ